MMWTPIVGVLFSVLVVRVDLFIVVQDDSLNLKRSVQPEDRTH